MLGSKKAESHWPECLLPIPEWRRVPEKRPSTARVRSFARLCLFKIAHWGCRDTQAASSKSGGDSVQRSGACGSHAERLRSTRLRSTNRNTVLTGPREASRLQTFQSARGLPMFFPRPPRILSAPGQVEESPVGWERNLPWGPGALLQPRRSMHH